MTEALLYERRAGTRAPTTLGPTLELLVGLAQDARMRPHDPAAADRFAMEFRDLITILRRAGDEDQDLMPDLVHALVIEIARHRSG
ncbi:hypothetical protein [Naasia sp. SYSU D00948]|uniref:hypothetical protein n=1 Tax=Naasia sp. SYSU D00948 TaxID=2817379 RepID=UPI001B314519|nr:hypothetical protein [Naasia sp. SYSU D00948]